MLPKHLLAEGRGSVSHHPPQSGTPTPVSSVRLGLLAAVIAAISAALPAADGAAGREPLPTTSQLLRVAGPAPWRGAGILHVRWRDADGLVVEEEWLDRRTGATRHVTHERADRDYVRLRIGRRLFEWSERDSYTSLSVFVDPHHPRLDFASRLLSYWHKLHRGHARVVGSGEVGDRPVWILQNIEPSSEAPRGLRAFADVDKETLLVLRERFIVRGRTATVTGEREELSPHAVPATLFATKRRWTSLERGFRYGELARGLPFRVYALGRRYGRLRFARAVLHDERGPLPARVRATLPELWIGYTFGGPYAAAVVQLMESRLPKGWSRVRGDEKIRIAGEIRSAHVGKRGRLFSAVVGETLIDGRSDLSRAEVVRVLEGLRAIGRK